MSTSFRAIEALARPSYSGGNSATTILGESGTSPDGLRFSSGIGVVTRVAGLDWADISARAEVAPRPIGIVEKE